MRKGKSTRRLSLADGEPSPEYKGVMENLYHGVPYDQIMRPGMDDKLWPDWFYEKLRKNFPGKKDVYPQLEDDVGMPTVGARAVDPKKYMLPVDRIDIVDIEDTDHPGRKNVKYEFLGKEYENYVHEDAMGTADRLREILLTSSEIEDMKLAAEHANGGMAAVAENLNPTNASNYAKDMEKDLRGLANESDALTVTNAFVDSVSRMLIDAIGEEGIVDFYARRYMSRPLEKRTPDYNVDFGKRIADELSTLNIGEWPEDPEELSDIERMIFRRIDELEGGEETQPREASVRTAADDDNIRITNIRDGAEEGTYIVEYEYKGHSWSMLIPKEAMEMSVPELAEYILKRERMAPAMIVKAVVAMFEKDEDYDMESFLADARSEAEADVEKRGLPEAMVDSIMKVVEDRAGDIVADRVPKAAKAAGAEWAGNIDWFNWSSWMWESPPETDVLVEMIETNGFEKAGAEEIDYNLSDSFYRWDMRDIPKELKQIPSYDYAKDVLYMWSDMWNEFKDGAKKGAVEQGAMDVADSFMRIAYQRVGDQALMDGYHPSEKVRAFLTNEEYNEIFGTGQDLNRLKALPVGEAVEEAQEPSASLNTSKTPRMYRGGQQYDPSVWTDTKVDNERDFGTVRVDPNEPGLYQDDIMGQDLDRVVSNIERLKRIKKRRPPC